MRIFYLAMIVLLLGGCKRSENSNQYNPAGNQLIDKGLVARIDHDTKDRRDVLRFGYPSKYTEAYKLIRTKEGQEKIGYSAGYTFREKEKLSQNRRNARVAPLEWQERGPANVPGRTRGVIIDAEDPTGNTWYAGSVGGGVWKTTDKGESWEILTKNIPNMAIACLATSPANPSILYAGTGEAFSHLSVIVGNGILKSTDKGQTWEVLSSTIQDDEFSAVSRIIVDPNNANVLLACTETGTGIFNLTQSFIFKSVDGGVSWTKVYASNSPIEQLIADPFDFSIQYAAVNGIGVLKSEDTGDSWFDSGQGILAQGRIELAVSNINSDTLFASVVGGQSGTGSDLYFSGDKAKSWVLLSDQSSTAYDYLNGQGNYDNTILAHPFESNTFYVGGVDLFKVSIEGEPYDTGEPTLLGLDQVNTGSFIELINFGAPFFGGVLDTGISTQKRPVEVLFGANRTQKAHRFTVGGQGAGVPATEYQYRDYVEVPFQVWDVETNTQLMVSFRDQQEDGKWNLIVQNQGEDTKQDSREYLFIHNIEYTDIASPEVAKVGGQEVEQMYFFWPILPEDGTFDEASLPESKLAILYGKQRLINSETINLTDGRAQYDNRNPNEVIHVDHHNLMARVTSEENEEFELIAANDGGLYYSDADKDPGLKGGSWNFGGQGYNTTQFYGADKMPGGEKFIGGAQDNGTWTSDLSSAANFETDYTLRIGGDGFEALWNYGNANELIGSSQHNLFGKSSDGGRSWQLAINGLNRDEAAANNFPFISRLSTSKKQPNTIYTVGRFGVYKSTDFGDNWELKPINENWSFSSFMHIKVSDANQQIVWAGSGMGSSYNFHVSVDGAENFSNTSNYDGTLLGVASGFATHPTEDSTAFALFSFANSPKVLKTEDLGNSWQDITGFSSGNSESLNGFPNVAVYCLYVFPNEPQKIWVGSEIGLVESLDGGETWHLTDNGFPAVAVWDIKQVDNFLVIASHGRGIWTVKLEELPEILVAPQIVDLAVLPQNDELLINLSVTSKFDSLDILLNNNLTKRSVADIEGVDTTFVIEAQEEGTISVQVVGYKNGQVASSGDVLFDYFKYGDALLEYETEFNSQIVVNDFLLNGFDVLRTVSGFSNGALHTPHPYKDNSTSSALLKKKIIVSNTNPTITYNEIAIVEPGEDGTEYGDFEFWDYVIVEGSEDGLNWEPLVDGYDARANSGWLQAYNEEADGKSNLFSERSIDLRKTFNAGDTIVVRFRLFADANSNGFGWVVDDLEIQKTEVLNVEKHNTISIYPNPATDYITINQPLVGAQNLNIIDLNGRVYPVLLTENRLDVSSLTEGLYILRFQQGGVNYSQRFYKN
ncbi:T9SS type A sorting domain-containing protein [Marinoscillum furvescens]|uniref:Putative secreted protein (Por secretion system target) n=1 Tax=Marinoscillum furvescens DSM 4134 TaxID=1122208 RepID=A0A3D9KZN8_MARFU|nr:T9SS type A sorting domain-containing protein [Marinoscillum furvescens]RED92625.1 putative secreted protein (Por secretion system target) [Marinoscillum furvescens DSM 4134]